MEWISVEEELPDFDRVVEIELFGATVKKPLKAYRRKWGNAWRWWIPFSKQQPLQGDVIFWREPPKTKDDE